MHPEMELYKTAAMTFEELGFLFPVHNAEQPTDSPFEASASVEFSGILTGKLLLSVYGDILPTLAANMLGSDGAPPVTQQHDALGEIANVVCGNVLPSLTGPREVFKISAPRVTGSDDLVARQTDRPTAQVDLALTEGRARISLYVD